MPLLKPLPPEGEIQAPILTKPKDITHGCLAFVQVNDPAKAAKFLRSMTNRLFPNGKGQPDVYWTLSITYKGMKSLEIPEETRLAFPAPFREGMAARAGMLGDTDGNHPREWKWPTDFSGRDIDPSNIDIIVQMLTSAPDHPDVPVFSQNDPTLKDHPLHQAFCDLKADCEATGLSLLGLEPMQRRTDENGLAIGHLGFADGVSQPSFSGKDDYKAEPVEPDGEDTYASTIRGDILLGRENSLDKELDPGLHKGERSRFERLELPFLDGTFQVIRKMALDVEAFNNVDRQVDSNACPVPKAERIQEMIFGRKKDGTPLIPVSHPLSNDFNYRNDPEGKLCPLQSHVRRTNPRIKGTPRLLRRGYSFGTFDHSVDVDRGLMFIAYNANIAEQFEQIQSWVAGANITGIPSFHSDPLLAPIRPDSNRVFRFEEKGEVVRVELADKPIATLRWGLYAFVPSREGLLKLASMAGSAETSMSDLACFGRRVKEMRIDSVPADQREDAWKILLEDRDHVRRDEREAIWAWIRERHNGVYDTGTENYGVLVGSEKGVRDVYLKSDNEISVREYWYRMRDSIGPQKLGYDAKPKKLTEPDEFYDKVKPGDHTKEASVLSDFIAKYSVEEIFNDAYSLTRKYLDELPVERQPMRRPTIGRPPENTGDPSIKTVGKRVDLVRMMDDVAAQLSAKWFGLPTGRENPYLIIGGPKDEEDKRPHCPEDLLNASFYVFGPAPTKKVKQLAMNEFTTNVAPSLARYFAATPNPPGYSLSAELKKAQANDPAYWTDQKVGEALAGVTFGFVGPVPGSFLTTMYDWIDDDMLRRVQQVYLANVDKPERSSAAKVLEPFLLAGMRGSPIPDLLYRLSVENVNIGGVDIAANRKITISNRSAVVDDPTAVDLLFGGDYWGKKGKKPMHSCPGQHMGLNTIYGVLAALFEKGRLRAEGPFTLRLDQEEVSENTLA